MKGNFKSTKIKI